VNKVYTATVVEDCDELFLQFPVELLENLDWKAGDTLVWVANKDGTFTIKKKE
jgi:hypothetical protein